MKANRKKGNMVRAAKPGERCREDGLLLALEAARMVTWELDSATGQITYSQNLAQIVRGQDTRRYCALDSLLPEVHPEDKDRLIAAVEKAVSGEAPLELEYRVRMLDGKFRWILLKGHAAGPGKRLRGASVDIHERKLLENQCTSFALLGNRLGAVSTPEEAARLILDTAHALIGWDAGYLNLYSEAEGRVTPILAIDELGGERRELKLGRKYATPSALTRMVLSRGPQLLARGSSGDGVQRAPFGDLGRPSESLMFAPVKSAGKTVGILSVQSYTPNAYSPDDLKLLVSLADFCGDALLRIQTADALRESERRLRLIADNTTDVIFAFDMDRRPVYANPAVKELTGYTFEEIQQQRFVNWIHPDDQERMLAFWEGLFRGQGYSDVAFRMVTKSGEIKWCSSSWGPIFDETGRQIGVQGHERDITERRVLERQLLKISAREQRRIGHALHDGVGQVLAGLVLKAKTLEDMVSGSAEATALAKRIVELVNSTIRQTRSLARGLDPVHVGDEGLLAALQGLAAHSSELLHVECVFRSDEEELSVPLDTGVRLYYIAQEAIHNAARHGRATRIEVKLALDEADLRLAIEDNGLGIQPKRLAAGSGMGLRIMRYRAGSIGATITVGPRPGGGTAVLCRLPRKLYASTANRRV